MMEKWALVECLKSAVLIFTCWIWQADSCLLFFYFALLIFYADMVLGSPDPLRASLLRKRAVFHQKDH